MSYESSPARYYQPVILDTDFADPARSLYIGVAGTLRVTRLDGAVIDFPAVVTGPLPIWVKRVHTAGTSATGIMALWG